MIKLLMTTFVINIRYDTETILYNNKRRKGQPLKYMKEVESYISYKEYFPSGE